MNNLALGLDLQPCQEGQLLLFSTLQLKFKTICSDFPFDYLSLSLFGLDDVILRERRLQSDHHGESRETPAELD